MLNRFRSDKRLQHPQSSASSVASSTGSLGPDASSSPYEQREFIPDKAAFEHQGLLYKKVLKKAWKERYVVLQAGVLYEFEVDEDSQPLFDAVVNQTPIKGNELLCNESKNKFVLEHHAGGRKYTAAFRAKSEHALNEWLRLLKDQTSDETHGHVHYYKPSTRKKLQSLIKRTRDSSATPREVCHASTLRITFLPSSPPGPIPKSQSIPETIEEHLGQLYQHDFQDTFALLIAALSDLCRRLEVKERALPAVTRVLGTLQGLLQLIGYTVDEHHDADRQSLIDELRPPQQSLCGIVADIADLVCRLQPLAQREPMYFTAPTPDLIADLTSKTNKVLLCLESISALLFDQDTHTPLRLPTQTSASDTGVNARGLLRKGLAALPTRAGSAMELVVRSRSSSPRTTQPELGSIPSTPPIQPVPMTGDGAAPGSPPHPNPNAAASPVSSIGSMPTGTPQPTTPRSGLTSRAAVVADPVKVERLVRCYGLEAERAQALLCANCNDLLQALNEALGSQRTNLETEMPPLRPFVVRSKSASLLHIGSGRGSEDGFGGSTRRARTRHSTRSHHHHAHGNKNSPFGSGVASPAGTSVSSTAPGSVSAPNASGQIEDDRRTSFSSLDHFIAQRSSLGQIGSEPHAAARSEPNSLRASAGELHALNGVSRENASIESHSGDPFSGRPSPMPSTIPPTSGDLVSDSNRVLSPSIPSDASGSVRRRNSIKRPNRVTAVMEVNDGVTAVDRSPERMHQFSHEEMGAGSGWEWDGAWSPTHSQNGARTARDQPLEYADPGRTGARHGLKLRTGTMTSDEEEDEDAQANQPTDPESLATLRRGSSVEHPSRYRRGSTDDDSDDDDEDDDDDDSYGSRGHSAPGSGLDHDTAAALEAADVGDLMTRRPARPRRSDFGLGSGKAGNEGERSNISRRRMSILGIRAEDQERMERARRLRHSTFSSSTAHEQHFAREAHRHPAFRLSAKNPFANFHDPVASLDASAMASAQALMTDDDDDDNSTVGDISYISTSFESDAGPTSEREHAPPSSTGHLSVIPTELPRTLSSTNPFASFLSTRAGVDGSSAPTSTTPSGRASRLAHANTSGSAESTTGSNPFPAKPSTEAQSSSQAAASAAERLEVPATTAPIDVPPVIPPRIPTGGRASPAVGSPALPPRGPLRDMAASASRTDGSASSLVASLITGHGDDGRGRSKTMQSSPSQGPVALTTKPRSYSDRQADMMRPRAQVISGEGNGHGSPHRPSLTKGHPVVMQLTDADHTEATSTDDVGPTAAPLPRTSLGGDTGDAGQIVYVAEAGDEIDDVTGAVCYRYALEDHHEILRVKLATVKQLMHFLVAVSNADPDYLPAFDLSFGIFTDADQVMRFLTDCHLKSYEGIVAGANLSEAAFEHSRCSDALARLLPRLLRDLNMSLLQRVADAITRLLRLGDVHFIELAVEVLQALSLALEERAKLEEQRRAAASPRRAIVIPDRPQEQQVFTRFESITDVPDFDVARELCLRDAELLAAITPEELISWRHESKRADCSNIIAVTNHFNSVSRWAATLLCRTERLRRRAKVLAKLVDVMRALRKLHNFNALLAILSGIDNAAVHRLKHTFDHAGSKVASRLRKLKLLMSRDRNFAVYRSACAQASLPAIPYLGLYLSDITFVHNGNPDFFDDCEGIAFPTAPVSRIVNFAKMQHFHSICSAVQHFQSEKYDYKSRPEVYSLFKDFEHLDDEALYQLSLQVEPRGVKAEDLQ